MTREEGMTMAEPGQRNLRDYVAQSGASRRNAPIWIYVLERFGLPTAILLLFFYFTTSYMNREQQYNHDDMQALAAALEDVRDGIDVQLQMHGITPPKRRLVKLGNGVAPVAPDGGVR